MSNQVPLADGLGRRARYLRLSVTDRCNFKCFYCVGCRDRRYIPHERILRYEEFYRLSKIARALGVAKIRVTGGEPFARRGVMAFLSGLREKFPDLRLALTTNASLLGPFLPDLAALGLASLNVSLDSFRSDTFRRITGSDSFALVRANIDRALALGVRVKINVVALAGVTDVQMADFVNAARTMPLDLRFIEFMPMGGCTLWSASSFLSCASLRKLASRHCDLSEAAAEDDLAGPARMCDMAGGKGRLGFISAVSDHFCATCNRLRLTAEGKLRTCLFADAETDLARLLRNPKISDVHIARAITASLARKPLGSDLLAARSGIAVARRQMAAIGG